MSSKCLSIRQEQKLTIATHLETQSKLQVQSTLWGLNCPHYLQDYGTRHHIPNHFDSYHYCGDVCESRVDKEVEERNQSDEGEDKVCLPMAQGTTAGIQHLHQTP